MEGLFSKEEAELIYQIPLSYLVYEDKLIWNGTVQGSFSVKSAYDLHREIQEMGKGQASYNSTREQFWSGLWKLNIHPTDKLFIWRACCEAIPTNQNLFKRKVLEKPLCPICLQEEETIIHAIWSCPAAQDFWHQCSRKIQKHATLVTSLLDLITSLAFGGGTKMVEELVVVARRI